MRREWKHTWGAEGSAKETENSGVIQPPVECRCLLNKNNNNKKLPFQEISYRPIRGWGESLSKFTMAKKRG